MEEYSDLINEHLRVLEPFKIEILDDKDRYYQLTSRIEKVGDDYLIVSPAKDGLKTFDLPVEAEISIVFYRNDGILYGLTKILARQSGDNARLKISLPYNIELINRRRAKRIRVRLRAEIEYLINKNDKTKKILNVGTSDINVFGVSYMDTEPFGKYHNIICKLHLDDREDVPAMAECRFVYSQKKTHKGQVVYKTALEFTGISRNDIDRIQKRCYRRGYA